MWIDHFKNMVNGDIPLQKSIYTVKPSMGLVKKDLQLISPSEAVVQRAKSGLKRSLKEEAVYNPKKSRTSVQSGTGRRRRSTKKTKKKKNKTKKKKRNKSNKRSKNRPKSSKKRQVSKTKKTRRQKKSKKKAKS